MSRRIFGAPPARFGRFFDEFRDMGFDQPLSRPYWSDYSLDDAHKLGSGVGELVNNEEQFSITIDVSQFSPEELKVSVNEGELVIEGKHAMKRDQFGEIERHFVRRFQLPKDIKPELVTSELSKDGKLTIQTPKNVTEQQKTRTIPIMRKD